MSKFLSKISRYHKKKMTGQKKSNPQRNGETHIERGRSMSEQSHQYYRHFKATRKQYINSFASTDSMLSEVEACFSTLSFARTVKV